MNYKLIDFKTNSDPRGSLTSIEELQDIPMDVKRIFYMHHVTDDRGGHAHIDTDQVLLAISGSFKLKLFDGKETEYFDMNDCTKGVYIPRLTFTDMYDFTSDAVCLVLANTHYDMGKSLRSMEVYMSYLKEHNII
jgi:dTDP-4-dehydrorhamnose 3,5-epimerase-like enzyme